MRGTGHMKKAFHKMRKKFKPGAVALLYHRIANLAADPFNLAVSPDHFSEQLDYIRRTCHPMRLVDLVDAMRERSLPHRAVAITFDDGYVDNFTHAYPLLKSFNIPATIFVTSEKVGSPYEFWWDDLERVILVPPHLPARLRISINGHEYEWRLESVEQRKSAHRDLGNLLKPVDANGRDRILAELTSWADLERSGRSDYRAMTTSELLDVAQSDWIDIGGHTVTHPSLSTLSAEAQRAEIVGGLNRLESILGSHVLTFAYPFGTPQDFTDETAKIVGDAGFSAAFTTVPGYIESGDNLFRLRRGPVFDWGAGIFQQQLERYFLERE
jgi:peptidoglycan/xylan/chitin deacetylase (PgdA/CDA1 family)